MRRVAFLVPLLAASLAAGASVAAGPDELIEKTQTSVEASHTATKDDKGVKPSFIAMPIPLSNPALGNGLAVGALLLYEPKGSGGLWTSGLGGLYTDTDSWGAAVFQKAHFREDRFRLTAGAGYADLNVKFYGIGAGAGERDRSIELNQSGTFVLAQGLYRLKPNVYVGAQYRFLEVNTSLSLPAPPAFPDLEPPTLERESRVSGLGIAAEYDTRDSEYGPHKGVYAQSQLLWNSDALGSDFEYAKFTGAVNGYHEMGKGVLAWRGSLCASGEGAPFYDLCMYGQSNDLRGYESGQYRDGALWAVQTEYRRPLFWRLGGVIFAGVGGIAPGIDKIGDSTILPAAGIGLRLAASKRYRVNMSLDVAWGHDSSAVYFYIGEAF